MNKKLLGYLAATLIFATCLGAQVLDRAKTIRKAGLLTGSLVAVDLCDLGDAEYVTIEIYNDGPADDANVLGVIEPQWGTTTNAFFPEPVNRPETIANGKQPYSRYAKQFQFSTAATGPIFTETFKRWGANRYFRPKLMESTGAGTTNSLIRVVATPSR